MAHSTTSSKSVLRVVITAEASWLTDLCDVVQADCGHEVVRQVSTAADMVRFALIDEPDLVVFEPKCCDGMKSLSQIYRERVVPAVAILSLREQCHLGTSLRDFALSYVFSPVTRRDLAPAIDVAIARAEEQRVLITENNKLKQQLENRKVIEKAKGILMKRHRWSEHDAFRRLQRSSMNHRTSMAQLAEAVLSGAAVSL